MNRPTTVGDCRTWGFRKLSEADIDDPGLTADLLLAHCLDVSRMDLPLMDEEEVSDDCWTSYARCIEQRAGHRPLQYITGETAFYGRTFAVDDRALIPRPETETLVEYAMSAVENSFDPERSEKERTICDLGTGSGVILLTICLELPSARGIGVERSEEAIELTRHNARRHGLLEGIDLIKGDFCSSSIEDALRERGPFDLVISNPPYVTPDEMEQLDPEVREHEPADALEVPGKRIDLYRSIVSMADRITGDDAVLAMETAGNQELSVETVQNMTSCSAVHYRSDHRGVKRFLIARKPS